MAVRGFFEYRLVEGKREDYLQLIKRLREIRSQNGFANYSVSESIDQKNRFVETFLIPSLEEYREREAKLLENPETAHLFRLLDTYIDGGQSGKKIWFFTELEFPARPGNTVEKERGERR
jgi:quinol monooxygenase YgiN